MRKVNRTHYEVPTTEVWELMTEHVLVDSPANVKQNMTMNVPFEGEGEDW